METRIFYQTSITDLKWGTAQIMAPNRTQNNGPLDISFDIPQDLKDQGIEALQIKGENGILTISNGPLILFPFHINNYEKTIEKMKAKLLVYKVDERLAEFYCVKITELLLIQLDIKTKCKRINQEGEQTKKEAQFIVDSIKRLRKEYKDIPHNIWEIERQKRYDNLYSVVKEKIPKAWESIELAITVKGVRRIEDITLPLIVIIQGNPGTWKTLGLEMLRRWPDICFKDKISPKSWVTHAAKDNKDDLDAIDLIREIKDKMLMIPELAPIFMQNEEVLLDTLSTLTRLADGNGLLTHSGLHGTRGVDGALMFTMLGAIVHVPPKVYKVLSNLGPKIYFYNTEFTQATKDDIINDIKNEKHESKKRAINGALFGYLQWLEVCPSLIEIKSGNVDDDEANDSAVNHNDEVTINPKNRVINRVIQWDHDKDDNYALEKVAELALLLAKLRGNAYTYQTKLVAKLGNSKSNEEGSDMDESQSSRYEYEYGYEEPIEEEARRAGQVLYNVARAHAFEVCGRNFITEDDLIIPIKLALSAANRLRVRIAKLLLTARNTDGSFINELDTTYIMGATRSSKSSVHRIMKELQILGLVEIGKTRDPSHENYIKLKEEFKWVREERFQNLLERAYLSPYSKYHLQEDSSVEQNENLSHMSHTPGNDRDNTNGVTYEYLEAVNVYRCNRCKNTYYDNTKDTHAAHPCNYRVKGNSEEVSS